MDDEICDMCDEPGHLVCSQCLSAVYCGTQCQAADYDKHADICQHVDEMTHAELLEEICTHLEHADSDDDSEFIEHGEGLLQSEASVEETRHWLATMILSQISPQSDVLIGNFMELIGRNNGSRRQSKPRRRNRRRKTKRRNTRKAKRKGPSFSINIPGTQKKMQFKKGSTGVRNR